MSSSSVWPESPPLGAVPSTDSASSTYSPSSPAADSQVSEYDLPPMAPSAVYYTSDLPDSPPASGIFHSSPPFVMISIRERPRPGGVAGLTLQELEECSYAVPADVLSSYENFRRWFERVTLRIRYHDICMPDRQHDGTYDLVPLDPHEWPTNLGKLHVTLEPNPSIVFEFIREYCADVPPPLKYEILDDRNFLLWRKKHKREVETYLSTSGWSGFKIDLRLKGRSLKYGTGVRAGETIVCNLHYSLGREEDSI